jgi:hypothetical protein
MPGLIPSFLHVGLAHLAVVFRFRDWTHAWKAGCLCSSLSVVGWFAVIAALLHHEK